MDYYAGDLHLGHRKVIDFDNRPFEDVEDMNLQIINNINKVVGKDDTLTFVGDISFTLKPEELRNLILKIKCKNLILIKGNHDDLIFRRFHLFENIFKEIHEMKIIKDNKVYVTICHYPLLSWKGMYHGGINVYAHVHTNDESIVTKERPRPNAYNAGIMFHNYMPVTLNQMKETFGYNKHYYDKKRFTNETKNNITL